MPSAGSSREQEEFERLRAALSASQAEVGPFVFRILKVHWDLVDEI